jgi:hypothetical protein
MSIAATVTHKFTARVAMDLVYETHSKHGPIDFLKKIVASNKSLGECLKILCLDFLLC